MGNLTTPLKATFIAALSAKLVSLLGPLVGLDPVGASVISNLVWGALTIGLSYVIPHDLGQGLIDASVVSLGLWSAGCMLPQQTGGPYVARDLKLDCQRFAMLVSISDPILTSKCAAAKNPGKDGYCIALQATHAAVPACYLAASMNDAAAVDRITAPATVPPAL